MGKYDHICKLSGAENYPQCGNNPMDFAEYASTLPQSADPNVITTAEREKILDWLAKDAQAKALIDRKISTVIASQLSDSQSAREQWSILSQHYTHNNLMSQYELRSRFHLEKLKDADDAAHYLGVFEDAQCQFIQMGISYSNKESIFDLLQGLPEAIEWQIFREFTMNWMTSTTSTTTTTTTPAPLTFEDVVKLFMEKANAIVRKQKLAGPGSEFANAAITPLPTSKINAGVKCTNPLCEGFPHAENHDHAHCYWPGGGMESRAPAWVCNKNQKTETAAVATTTSPPSSNSTINSSPTVVSPETRRRELSCMAIVEVPDNICCHASVTSTILDSGSTSHLIMDCTYFINFREEDRPPVMTANHGSLVTMGRETCIGELTLNGERHRLTLHEYLHAPG
ncbi:hypothetical protein HD554DRAFT_2282646, partial [Boletus coccyginus]